MSRFDRLYQGAEEKRKRMEARQKMKMEQKDANLTFIPKTNNPSSRNRTTAIGPTTRPGPSCTVEILLNAIIDAISTENTTDTFAEYTNILNKILAPIVVPARRPPAKNTAVNSERFKSLYDDSVQRRKAQKKREEEESSRKLYSFAPKINKTPKGTVDDQDKEGRFGRLYKDAELRRTKFAKSLKEKNQSTVKHSFQPKINKQTGNSSSDRSKSRFDQLYADGRKKRTERQKEIKERREEVKRLREEEEKVVSTPVINKKRPRRKKNQQQRPEVDSNTKSNPSKISKVRQKAMEKKRDNAMKPKKKRKKKKKKSDPPSLPGAYSKDAVAKYRARLEAHRQSNECTFSPQINRRSKRDQDGDTSVFERLQKGTKAKYERIKQRESQRPHHCSFTPAINPGPSRNGTVFSRLDQESKKKIERVRNRVAKLDPECTFSPRINGQNNGMILSSPRRPQGSPNTTRKLRPEGGRKLLGDPGQDESTTTSTLTAVATHAEDADGAGEVTAPAESETPEMGVVVPVGVASGVHVATQQQLLQLGPGQGPRVPKGGGS